ncbi:MAG: hypothetical protein KJ587_01300 [Alphaproteobacteria bacterium]|nr:hypothetical protein [Alphaproteobacteria bacterium]
MALLKNITKSAPFSIAAMAAVGFLAMTTQSHACFFGDRYDYRHSGHDYRDTYVGDTRTYGYRTRGWWRGDGHSHRHDRKWGWRDGPLVKGWRWRDGPLVRGWRKHDRWHHR